MSRDSEPGRAAPGVPGAASYRVVHRRDGDTGDEPELLLAARRAARAIALATHGDAGAYSLLFHGAAVRRVPWPHVHVVPAGSVRLRRRALGLVALKGPLRRLACLQLLLSSAEARLDRLRLAWADRRNPTGPCLPSPAPEALRPSLVAAWEAVGATAPAPADYLIELWSAPHRRYHTLGHLAAMLQGLGRHKHQAVSEAELVLAIWFHDAIQVPGRRDDEERSARLAERLLRQGGAPGAVADRVGALVRVTAGHRGFAGADGALLSDLDLAVLGAPTPAYERYRAQVRAEFGWVSERRWRAGRIRVLRSLLDGGVYRTANFVAEREARARTNLRGELESLGAG